MLQIKEVQDVNGLKKFIALPWTIYKNDPNWVPPLRGQQFRTLQGKNNPFLANGEHTFFLAQDGEERVLGRILVGINQKLNREKKKAEGYLSLFEAVNDREVAFALFDAASQWLRARGLTSIVGPVSPTNGDDNRGILIQGFDGPPVLMNSYNPPYYEDFFEAYGFRKDMDLFAFYLDVASLDTERFDRVVSYAMRKYKFQIERFDRTKLEREIRDIKQILDLAMPASWEHLTPPSLEEIRSEFQTLVQFMDADLVYIARAGTEPIGFVVGLPDFNQVLKRLNGRLFPFGWVKYLWYKRRITGARIFIQFVVPRFRNKAVNSAIYHRLMVAARRKGYIYGEGSAIAEMNKESIRSVEGAGGRLYRTYRIYRKEIS
ncbi:MAG: N-acetyltransferase [Firmicutes bacterium]|nr:N-acetyltransferase [Bacillota bacterium]